MERSEIPITRTGSATVWDRVVCAIDQGPLSIHAARTAARLMPSAGSLTLCTVVGTGEADVVAEQTRTQAATAALARAQAHVQPFHDAELHLREGSSIGRLAEELLTERATLVTVGSHASGGAKLGSVARAMLHDAPCSVLIAHSADADGAEVVIGFDGSGGARRALAVGRELSERLSLKLRVLVAAGDAYRAAPECFPAELGEEIDVSVDPRTAVEALAEASRAGRLLVLGSRHLPAALALSSVSEQAARRATCPVLVVR